MYLNGQSVDYKQTVTRISTRCLIGNIILAEGKLIAGIFGHSYAMISDAIHSLSDVLGSLVLIIGVKLSGREADEDHPYGHERFESIASLCLGLFLLAAGFQIGKAALLSICSRSYLTGERPGLSAALAATVSILVKEGMYLYVMHYSRALSSKSLRAEAWHHRSDALSSIGALIGILGALRGFYILDPLASIIISLLILKSSIQIFRDGISQMTDRACDKALETDIRQLICDQPSVHGIDLLRTRQFGRKVYMDLEVRMEGSLTLHSSHQIAEKLHDLLEDQFPQVKHVMIHVNPDNQGTSIRGRFLD